MNKVIFVVALAIGILALSSLALAEEVVLVNEKGQVQTMEKPETWRELNESEKTAYGQPGLEVGFGELVMRYERIGFFHLKPIKEYHQAVVFDGDRLQVVDKMTTKEDEPIFAEFVTLALIAMGFMVISNGLLLKDWRIYRVFESDASWVIAAIAFVVTTVCIVCLPFGVSFSSVTFVAAAIANFAVVIVLPAFGARKVALFFSFLFYILLGIALFV